MREVDEEFFWLDACRMKVGSFAFQCHAVLNSVMLDRALKQMLRRMALFLGEVSGDLRLEEGKLVISITNCIADAPAGRFAGKISILMVHGLICWLAGKRIALVLVLAELAHPRQPHASKYAVFSQHLGFDAPCTAIRFDAKLIASLVIQRAATLKQFLYHVPQSVSLK